MTLAGKHCVVVGAGISGLMAATELQAFGLQVTVLDKGRGVGGRMATRRINTASGPALLDHGAQFFTVRDPLFAEWVQQWRTLELVREWSRGFGKLDGHPRYVCPQGMTAIAKHLAAQLTVRTQARVQTLHLQDDGWHLTLESGEALVADGLLLTAPVPQSLALLRSGNLELTQQDQKNLESLHYDPCLAALVVVETRPELPEPGALQLQAEPLAWIADNARKGVSEQPALTLHAGPQFSAAHWEADPQATAQQMIEAAQAHVSFQAKETQLHRWLYSQPQNPWPQPYYLPECVLPLALAGDAFGHARVEGATLSGLAAAEQLLIRFSQ